MISESLSLVKAKYRKKLNRIFLQILTLPISEGIHQTNSSRQRENILMRKRKKLIIKTQVNID